MSITAMFVSDRRWPQLGWPDGIKARLCSPATRHHRYPFPVPRRTGGWVGLACATVRRTMSRVATATRTWCDCSPTVRACGRASSSCLSLTALCTYCSFRSTNSSAISCSSRKLATTLSWTSRRSSVDACWRCTKAAASGDFSVKFYTVYWAHSMGP